MSDGMVRQEANGAVIAREIPDWNQFDWTFANVFVHGLRVFFEEVLVFLHFLQKRVEAMKNDPSVVGYVRWDRDPRIANLVLVAALSTARLDDLEGPAVVERHTPWSRQIKTWYNENC